MSARHAVAQRYIDSLGGGSNRAVLVRAARQRLASAKRNLVTAYDDADAIACAACEAATKPALAREFGLALHGVAPGLRGRPLNVTLALWLAHPQHVSRPQLWAMLCAMAGHQVSTSMPATAIHAARAALSGSGLGITTTYAAGYRIFITDDSTIPHELARAL